jgi:hypothetical protein
MNILTFYNMKLTCWNKLHKRKIPKAQCRNIQLVDLKNSKHFYKQMMKSNKSQMKNKQEKDRMCTSARHTSIVVAIKKYHGNKTNALHFLGIVYKKPWCLNPYEKLGRSSLYDWFTNRREVKAKYAYLVELSTRIQMRKWNLQVLENYLVSWLNHVAKDEGGKSTPNNIYYPTHILWNDQVFNPWCDLWH